MGASDTRQKDMQDCEERAYKEFNLDLSVLKQMDRIYSEFLTRIDQIQPENYLEQANYALAVRSYRFLQCATDKLENGYYDVAITLLRSVYEDLVQMKYFVKIENTAEKWCLMKKDKNRTQREMRRILGITNDTYGLLSNYYSHPMELGALIPAILEVLDNGKNEYHPNPYYLRDECRYCLALWIHFANETIKQLQIVFKAAQIDDKDWKQKMGKVQTLASDYAKEIDFELRKLAEGKQEGEEQ